MTRFSALIAAAAGIAGLAAVPAHAEDLRVQVSYADLDIGSDAGAAAFAARLEAGAQQACARSGEMRSVKSTAVCKDQFLAEVVKQLNAKGETLVAGKLAAKG